MDALPRSTRSADCDISRPDWFSEDLTTLFDLLAQNKIKPVIAARMPLAEASRAHELVEKAEVQGKIVLTVAEPPT